eukprot:CAMPEP_0198135394 /NCGR_PEP_ID=MMETSP1442-20131203/60570_1 /TAXON_ID= /ORGANISM="Craspedostauros australis, Strain CCMP3328" /LENGTH=286 /DNA_ID=CAMNT_0043796563 /DNA_START=78 /DNA_END=937 /DNA_ORIENTATION=+
MMTSTKSNLSASATTKMMLTFAAMQSMLLVSGYMATAPVTKAVPRTFTAPAFVERTAPLIIPQAITVQQQTQTQTQEEDQQQQQQQQQHNQQSQSPSYSYGGTPAADYFRAMLEHIDHDSNASAQQRQTRSQQQQQQQQQHNQQSQSPSYSYDLGIGKNKPFVPRVTTASMVSINDVTQHMNQHESTRTFPSPLMDEDVMPATPAKDQKKNKVLPKIRLERRSADVLSITANDETISTQQAQPRTLPTITPKIRSTEMDINTIWVEMLIHSEQQTPLSTLTPAHAM